MYFFNQALYYFHRFIVQTNNCDFLRIDSKLDKLEEENTRYLNFHDVAELLFLLIILSLVADILMVYHKDFIVWI